MTNCSFIFLFLILLNTSFCFDPNAQIDYLFGHEGPPKNKTSKLYFKNLDQDHSYSLDGYKRWKNKMSYDPESTRNILRTYTNIRLEEKYGKYAKRIGSFWNDDKYDSARNLQIKLMHKKKKENHNMIPLNKVDQYEKEMSDKLKKLPPSIDNSNKLETDAFLRSQALLIANKTIEQFDRTRLSPYKMASHIFGVTRGPPKIPINTYSPKNEAYDLKPPSQEETIYMQGNGEMGKINEMVANQNNPFYNQNYQNNDPNTRIAQTNVPNYQSNVYGYNFPLPNTQPQTFTPPDNNVFNSDQTQAPPSNILESDIDPEALEQEVARRRELQKKQAQKNMKKLLLAKSDYAAKKESLKKALEEKTDSDSNLSDEDTNPQKSYLTSLNTVKSSLKNLAINSKKKKKEKKEDEDEEAEEIDEETIEAMAEDDEDNEKRKKSKKKVKNFEEDEDVNEITVNAHDKSPAAREIESDEIDDSQNDDEKKFLFFRKKKVKSGTAVKNSLKTKDGVILVSPGKPSDSQKNSSSASNEESTLKQNSEVPKKKKTIIIIH